VYRGPQLLTTWPVAGLKPLWKQPVGEGYASFVVAGGHAFTIEQRGEREVVAAYDVRTGRQIWTNTWTAAFREFMGGDGPRATPTFADGLLYALGAQGELRCLEAATGRIIWRTNILDDAGAMNVQWGMAAAPLLVDDTVVVHPGGPTASPSSRTTRGPAPGVVVAERWRRLRVPDPRDDRRRASDCRVQRHAPDGTQARGRIVPLGLSLAHAGGHQRVAAVVDWRQPCVPVLRIRRGAAVLELSPEGSGFKVREVWRNTKIKNRFNSSVLKDGYIYGFDESILACVDAATGELKWKGGRYGYGQMLLAGDQLVVLTEDGELALVRATPAGHQELARFEAISGKTWNHPAITDGLLLVRNLREMAAFDLKQK
jgi:outer membrane protein assembly factor BamB